METPPVTRRLAAILIADVVGYTRLMEKDEAGTHARLREIRDTIVDPKIAEYGGRIVKTAGDGMLVEFPSATAALRCAVEVQREMGHRNLYVAPDAKIEFRIGINLGDMLIDGDDIAGDGVNVASRLETLAEPGGICIGSTVYEQVHEDLGFGFVDIGEQQVKNIARPIRAYRVKLGSGAAQAQGKRQLLRGKRWRWLAGAVGVIAIGAVAAFLLRNWSGPAGTVPAAPTVGQAPALSIAIMPFATPGGNPSDDRLAESLTQDVTTALGRSARYALVVSHGLASGYKGKAIDARAVGRELNVRYLAEGEIRHAGDKLVLNTTLIDTGSATQVWNDRLIADAPLAAGYDAVAAQLAQRIKIALVGAESRRAQHQSNPSATAVELWLRADSIDGSSVKGLRDTRKLYDEALRLDPRFVGALTGQVWTIGNLLELDPQADRDRLLREMDEYSLRAVAADSRDPRAWLARATALRNQWRWNEALEALSETLRIDPGRTDVYLDRAFIMGLTGRFAEGLEQFDKSIAVDPRQAADGSLLRGRCRLHLFLGHYDEAITACERAAALENLWPTYLYLTAAYAQKDQMTKASVAKSQLLKFQPGFTIARLKALRLTDNPVYWQQAEAHIFPGLRKAGIPEQ
jgi:class 3 adenylate cyclase/TolB-like protein